MLQAVSVLEDDLMEIEMLLQDALIEATNKFKENIKDFNTDINNKTVNFTTYVAE